MLRPASPFFLLKCKYPEDNWFRIFSSPAAQKHLRSFWRAMDQPLARLLQCLWFLNIWICSEAKVRCIDELGILLEESIKYSSLWIMRQKQAIVFKASVQCPHGLTLNHPKISIMKDFSDYLANNTDFQQKALGTTPSLESNNFCVWAPAFAFVNWNGAPSPLIISLFVFIVVLLASSLFACLQSTHSTSL